MPGPVDPRRVLALALTPGADQIWPDRCAPAESACGRRPSRLDLRMTEHDGRQDGTGGRGRGGQQAPGRGLPPVHLWNPAHCGDIDIVIKRDGLWFHEGTPIGREALVRLFSTVLRKDPDGFHLVTPVEKMTITVEDAPFIAVRVDRVGEALRFVTNVGDVVEAGPDNAIRVEVDPATGEPRPYLHVRRGLEALIRRPVFYELVEMAEERDTPEGPRLGVRSNGAWFPVGPARAHAAMTPAELRAWIVTHLDPIESYDPAARPMHSDFDLDPRHARPTSTLKPAAVLVALVEHAAGLSVLLTRRADTLRSHTGQVAFPGGRCDPGRDALGDRPARSRRRRSAWIPAA